MNASLSTVVEVGPLLDVLAVNVLECGVDLCSVSEVIAVDVVEGDGEVEVRPMLGEIAVDIAGSVHGVGPALGVVAVDFAEGVDDLVVGVVDTGPIHVRLPFGNVMMTWMVSSARCSTMTCKTSSAGEEDATVREQVAGAEELVGIRGSRFDHVRES